MSSEEQDKLLKEAKAFMDAARERLHRVGREADLPGDKLATVHFAEDRLREYARRIQDVYDTRPSWQSGDYRGRGG